MSTRTAAIVIDDFLSDDKWNWIQGNLDDYLNTTEFVENIHEPYKTSICLLYTSPSPRDQRGSRMPSSA